MRRRNQAFGRFNPATAVALLFLMSWPLTAVSAATEAVTLRLSIIPHRSTLGNEQAYRPLIDALEKATSYAIYWVGAKNYADVIDNLRTHQADLACLGPFAYIEAQDKFGVRLIARTLDQDRRDYYHSIIVARKDSNIHTLFDLKGRSFAFTDPHSTSGYLYPNMALKKAGIALTDFSRTIFTKKHANSLLAVYHGQADAGATASTAVNKVKVDFSQIDILWQSAPIYRGPWVMRKDINEEIYQKLKAALLNLNSIQNADQIFKNLGTHGFIEGQDSDYDSVRELRVLGPLFDND